MPRMHTQVATANAGLWQGGGINNIVQTQSGVFYVFYIDTASDLAFRKSSDGGITWSAPTTVIAGTHTAISVWYGRWSGLSNDLIYCAAIDSGADDILFRTVDTASSDALGTQTVVFAGATTAAGGALTITVGRDSRICVAGAIDAGAEDGAWSSTDGGATWTDTIADPSEAATQDQYLLLPGWNADTADLQLIFWDADADELSVKRYDDSANTWGETSISGSMADLVANTAFRSFDGAADLSNSRNVVIAWSAVDTANADLRCWLIDDTTITEVTNVVQNSTDDQGLCAITIDSTTGHWWVFYGGKSDGSETWLGTDLHIYYKVSTDSGTTWSSERQASDTTTSAINYLISCPRLYSGVPPCLYEDAILLFNAQVLPQRAPSMTGGMAT